MDWYWYWLYYVLVPWWSLVGAVGCLLGAAVVGIQCLAVIPIPPRLIRRMFRRC